MAKVKKVLIGLALALWIAAIAVAVINENRHGYYPGVGGGPRIIFLSPLPPCNPLTRICEKP